MARPVAEFVRAQPDGRWPKYCHEECLMAVSPKADWKQMMANGFFLGVKCSHCGVLLLCKCSMYKLSQPNSEDCSHE